MNIVNQIRRNNIVLTKSYEIVGAVIKKVNIEIKLSKAYGGAIFSFFSEPG